MRPHRWLAIALCIAVILVAFGIEIAKRGGDLDKIAIYLGPLVVACGVAIWAHVTSSRARWPSAVCFLGGAPMFHLLLIPPSFMVRILRYGTMHDRVAVAGLLTLLGLTVYALIVKPTPPPPDPVARAVANE